jgi:tetratricopeptide (TPR) repeat protein
MVAHDYDNMKICLAMAIEKNYTPAMVHLARFYDQIEHDLNEMIRLYTLAYENGNKDGAFGLVDYYKSTHDIANVLKYLNIGVDQFNDQESIYDLVMYYQSINDETNSLKYCDKLIQTNPNRGHFIKGKMFQTFKKYDEMKIHFNSFFESLVPTNLLFNTDELNNDEKQFSYVIKLYMDNELDLPYVQFILHKFNITTSTILGHLQFKLNKTKLTIYNQVGTCAICFNDNINLQLFDCLGHHYCRDCTISMDKCAVCRCTKKCSHM